MPAGTTRFLAGIAVEVRGLALMDAPSGTLIAYSAAPMQKAKDGDGENSPYTAALAESLVVPGLKVEDVFKRVRVSVEAATNGEQTPWEKSSLRGDFYFVAKAEAPPAPVPQPETARDVEPSELTRQELAARGYEGGGAHSHGLELPIGCRTVSGHAVREAGGGADREAQGCREAAYAFCRGGRGVTGPQARGAPAGTDGTAFARIRSGLAGRYVRSADPQRD